MYSRLYLAAYEFMKANEGGFSDRPGDKGGATLFGVTVVYFPLVYYRIYRAWKEGRKEDLENLLLDFYHNEFWNPKYEELTDKRLAIRLFDLGVNLGKKTAVRLLQRANNNISSMNLAMDGVFGTNTLAACNYLNKLITRNSDPLYEEFVEIVENHYRSLKDFIHNPGWINRLHKKIDYA